MSDTQRELDVSLEKDLQRQAAARRARRAQAETSATPVAAVEPKPAIETPKLAEPPHDPDRDESRFQAARARVAELPLRSRPSTYCGKRRLSSLELRDAIERKPGQAPSPMPTRIGENIERFAQSTLASAR